MSHHDDQQLREKIRDLLQQEHEAMPEKAAAGIFAAILGKDSSEPVRTVPFTNTWWRVAAACIILVTAAGVFFAVSSKRDLRKPAGIHASLRDVPPGKDGAILTLEDGSQVSLDSIQDGTAALQGGTEARVVNGTLMYGENGDRVVYNTMTTPKGRQYRLTLADGTRVWLNAESSIRFPNIFRDKNRLVQVTGEAYFEIAGNARTPFIVEVNNYSAVKVLGTSFNINAYANEAAMKTTLLEGAVAVQLKLPGSSAQKPVILKPGQQAQIATATPSITVTNNVDVNKVVAWKEGAFNFEGLTLEEVMKQLERWYDIKVEIKGSGTKHMFWGEMGRNVQLSTVLAMFRKMGMDYEWNDSTLVLR